MIEKPIIENDFYDPLKSLQHSKNKNLAHQNFRYTHSQIERIEVSRGKSFKNMFVECSEEKLLLGLFTQ